MVAELFASIVSKCCLISYVHEFRIRRILDNFKQYSYGINRFNIRVHFASQKNTVITVLGWNAVVSG